MCWCHVNTVHTHFFCCKSLHYAYDIVLGTVFSVRQETCFLSKAFLCLLDFLLLCMPIVEDHAWLLSPGLRNSFVNCGCEFVHTSLGCYLVTSSALRDSSQHRCLYITRKLLSCSVCIHTFVIASTFKNAFTMKTMTTAISWSVWNCQGKMLTSNNCTHDAT